MNTNLGARPSPAAHTIALVFCSGRFFWCHRSPVLRRPVRRRWPFGTGLRSTADLWHQIIRGFVSLRPMAIAVLIGVVCLATARGNVEPPASARTQPVATHPAKNDAIRFATFNLWLDAGAKPLAAYQVELHAVGGSALLVGLEGGEPAAFRQPPYYDTRALVNEKLIVAAYSTNTDLPTGRFIAARLHLQITGEQDPTFEIKVRAAAAGDGSATVVRATVERNP